MANSSKLIDKDPKGTYCILFQNKHELHLDEIKNLFSQFGKIEKINTARGKRGYCFIRYNTYDEAEKALIGLKDHPKIAFAPVKNRYQENSERKDFSIATKLGGSGSKQRRTSHGHNVSEKALTKNTREETPWGDKSSHFTGQETKSPKKNNEKTPLGNKSALLKDLEIKLQKNWDEETPWGDKLPLVKSPAKRPHKIHTNFHRNTESLSTKGSEKRHQFLPLNSNQTSAEKTSEEEMPDLISTAGNSELKNKNKKKILEAQEIIVGNIHVEYGAGYILHLMDKFEPIAISNISTTPKHGRRYCHVYFKTVKNAVEVENKFDKLSLSGQKLVVLRPEHLMKELAIF